MKRKTLNTQWVVDTFARLLALGMDGGAVSVDLIIAMYRSLAYQHDESMQHAEVELFERRDHFVAELKAR